MTVYFEPVTKNNVTEFRTNIDLLTINYNILIVNSSLSVKKCIQHNLSNKRLPKYVEPGTPRVLKTALPL